MESTNPLKQYFRSNKLYMPLPSGKDYYAPGIIELLDSGEIGIMPMTGKDELTLKNPDALLNGDALIQVINSCVPCIKNVKSLLANDIEAIITGIRCATYHDGLETQIHCPECGHESSYDMDLNYAIDNMTFLEPEYVVNLESGLSVFVKPYSYPDLLKGLHSQFEQSKITRSIENRSSTDEEKMRVFSQVFKNVAKLTVELITSSIIKIVDESNGVNVSDPATISEFLQNIDRGSMLLIEDQIKEINTVGIKRTFTTICEKCNHTWENKVDFNPVNFS